MNGKLLKAHEVAELLSLSQERVYTLTREGILPSVRLGRQLRWDVIALKNFISSGGKGFAGGWKREA